MSLLTLPTEIILKIHEYLGLEDLANLGRVCMRLNSVKIKEKVWCHAITKSHPRLAQDSCQAELLRMRERYGSWRNTALARNAIAHELVTALDKMAEDFFAYPGTPDLAMERLRGLISRFGPLFTRDALLDVIHPKFGNGDDNLARRYYARMLYREVQRDSVLLPMFRRFATLPPHRATPHEAAHLLNLWMTPEETSSYFNIRYCHDIATLVLAKARKHLPSHPITAWKEPRKLAFPDSSATLWTDEDSLQLLDVMNEVLYHDLRLGKCPADPQVNMDEMVDEEEEEEEQEEGDEEEEEEEEEEVQEGRCPVTYECVWMASLYTVVAGMLGLCVHSQRCRTGNLPCWYSRNGTEYVLVNTCRYGFRLPMEAACQLYGINPDRVDINPSPRPLQDYIEHFKAERSMSSKCDGPAEISALQLLSLIAETDFQPFYGVTMEIMSLYMYWRPMYVFRHIKNRIIQSPEDMIEDEMDVLTGHLNVLVDLHLQQVDAMERGLPQAGGRLIGPALWQRRFSVGDIVVCPGGDRGVVCVQMPFDRVVTKVAMAPALQRQSQKVRHPYFVLVDNSQYAYLAGDELEFDENPGPIKHHELGRYFLRFSGGRYVPLPSLEQRRSTSLSAPGQSSASNSGVKMDTLMEALPREVPETWVGEWPEIQPDEVIAYA